MARARRLTVRRSGVHGRGVFAGTDLDAGAELIEYRGEIVTWQEASERYENSEQDAGHTYFFDLGDGRVIDGGRGGNSSRWINHGCEPNCEPVDLGGRILIRTLRAIPAGTELLLDYALEVDEGPTDELQRLYACACGARTCRGTMLGQVVASR